MVAQRVSIPEDEIRFRVSRAGGPGGQHVNRRATRVEARWNVLESAALSEAQRARVLEKLDTRIGKDGVLRVVADDERSQHLNKELAVRRLRAIVARAAHAPKPRKKTRPPKSAIETRLQEKREQAEKKKRRKPPSEHD